MILLENVSGTGITIGSNFKELYDIIKKINAKERIEFQDINIILDLIDRNIDLEKLREYIMILNSSWGRKKMNILILETADFSGEDEDVKKILNLRDNQE